ncbi:UPF0738 family protein [Ureibacillus sinduriensis]|uniref:Uncharacterized protein n=1 Tax=Ureibacillus sinduriensis BLB-1 = JCM 15800 TaxID=1384057 RepID=A0A0A3HTS1_9BACL|nr:hypothetical protein [Ureibacillus sinduriensis]KGR73693.1 hypothetical protein CD33_16850 [Ureibacillus sinduriensis BLB-1 = JCM 15800]
MRTIYLIEKYQFVHNDLHLSLNENQSKIQIQPAGQILADSDHLAFIYLVEEQGEYSYIYMPEDLWPALVRVLKSGKNPYLILEEQKIELTNFTDELHMLLFNIEGNENYGNAFVEAVETAFAEILKEEA